MAIKYNVVQKMTWIWGRICKEYFLSTGAPLIDCQRRTLAPLCNSGANAASVSVQTLPVLCHYSGHGGLTKPTMPYHPTLTSSYVHHSSHRWTAPFLSYYIVT